MGGWSEVFQLRGLEGNLSPQKDQPQIPRRTQPQIRSYLPPKL